MNEKLENELESILSSSDPLPSLPVELVVYRYIMLPECDSEGRHTITLPVGAKFLACAIPSLWFLVDKNQVHTSTHRFMFVPTGKPLSPNAAIVAHWGSFQAVDGRMLHLFEV